jgi:tetratricopeptide (TPR) repeat protein
MSLQPVDDDAAPSADESLFRNDPDGAAVTPLQRVAAALRDRYEIRREIGRGGAAFVFLATDLRANRDIAVKVLRPELTIEMGEARFKREIEVAGQLHHPNILPLLDVGSAAGQLYFTMPYVEGETLRARLKREGQLSVHDALRIARDISNALDHAHARGVVHRDIKPGNVLLDVDKTLVADFGIARAMSVAAVDQITESGIAVGTPEYMSPEQGTGDRRLDARSDVYALGCVVYEMFAGEPPFTGPTLQAIVARHCQEPPRSLRIIRPSIPVGVERAIERALAKAPVDRFAKAGQFVDALETGLEARTDIFGLAHLTRRSRLAVGAAVLAIGGMAAWTALRARSPVLDRNRIVVFPLYDGSAAGASSAGEGVATFIGYALDGTRPLKWIDGWELLNRSQSTVPGRVGATQGRRISRSAGARFYIDGSILRRPDSVTVILRLNDVQGDSILRIAGRSAPVATASLPQLGLQAAGGLLPELVAPGGRIDLAEFSRRDPVAVANFLQGEREYRRMQFAAAMPHYHAALARDSAFALAALRGAYAASWSAKFEEATQLVETALRQNEGLNPSQLNVARGLAAYLDGSADSAVLYLRAALRSDSAAHAAWTLLGETYSRLLPAEWASDSLARATLERARTVDPSFAPTLVLLEEIALRDGDVDRAVTLRGELRTAEADTTHATARALMLRCVRDGPGSINWTQATAADALAVLSVGKLLSGQASQPQCAISAFQAVLSSQDPPRNVRLGALLGALAQLAAIDQSHQSPLLLALKGASGVNRHIPVLATAAATAALENEARAIADTAARSYNNLPVPLLWLLGNFEASRNNVPRLQAILRTLRVKADSSQLPRDARIVRAVDARLRLLKGDTVTAIAILGSLRPSASRLMLAWWPWETHGPEYMLLAQLLFATGRYEEARQVATRLDATEPVTYPFYIRQSLELRMRAAEAMRNATLATQYRRRLQKLSSSNSRSST